MSAAGAIGVRYVPPLPSVAPRPVRAWSDGRNCALPPRRGLQGRRAGTGPRSPHPGRAAGAGGQARQYDRAARRERWRQERTDHCWYRSHRHGRGSPTRGVSCALNAWSNRAAITPLFARFLCYLHLPIWSLVEIM